MLTGHQIIKCRDDRSLIGFSKTNSDTGPDSTFKLLDGFECSWLKKNETFRPPQLRDRIEPWLTALFQSEHLAVLIGSGLSTAIHHIATGTPLLLMNQADFSYFNQEISLAAMKTAELAGRESGNFEDQIRVANELLRGLEIVAGDTTNDPKVFKIKQDLTNILHSFSIAVLKGESDLISVASTSLDKAFDYLVSFLMSFASRTGTRDRLQIFTTNYDRFIEAGAEVAGLHLIDRFVGSLAPIFRSSRLDVDMHYNPPGIRGEPRYLEGVAKFTKLHGSLDWVNVKKSIRRIGLPFGAESIDPYLKAPGFRGVDALQLMIYPNSSKDRETASYPYVELFRDFAAAICRPNSTVVTYGYSFGDEHINRVIEDMLTIPSTHLVVIAYDDVLGRIMRMFHSLGRHAQITLLVGNHLGDLQSLVDNYLPKPAIDRTTFRMAELLSARWAVSKGASGSNDAVSDAQGEDKQ